MAWYYGNYGELIHVSNGDPRFQRDAIFYPDPAPVSFRMPPFYNDAFSYRPSFRDQHPDFSHGGVLIPAFERVHIRREDPYPYPYPTPTPPWWLNRDYPHYYGGYPYPAWVGERQERCSHGDDEEDSHLEFYVPQLYSVCRERKVESALRAFPGVMNVVTDRVEKKVVVVGYDLCEEHVLRHLKRVRHMERSVLWRDRQS